MSFARLLSIIFLIYSHTVAAVDFAPASQAPDVLALALRQNTGEFKIFCSGVLVHPEIILTAAHCLREGNRADTRLEYRQKLKDIKVFLGTTSDEGQVSDQLVEIESFHIHPRYLRDIRGLADIAVIRLRQPLEHLKPFIRPIATDFELLKSIKRGFPVEIVGFGFSEQQIGRSSRTQEVFGSQHSGTLLVEGKTSSEVLVVAGKAVDRFGLYRPAPRDGDSGGPLFYTYQGKSYLLGLVSRASRFNHGPQGTAFSNVRHWMCWIESVARVQLKDPTGPDFCATTTSSAGAASLMEFCQKPRAFEAYTLQVLHRTLKTESCEELTQKASELTNLSLDASYIKDIGVLRFFPQLERLILRDNAITDLSVLTQLPKLRLVDVSYNNVRQFPDLVPRVVLVGKRRQYNNITRTSFIRMCQDPSVQGEARRTISAILHMFSLESCVDANYELIRRRELNFFSPKDLVDFSPLENLHTLEGLNLSGQPVRDLSFLETLGELRELNLSQIPLENFQFFSALSHLNVLKLEESGLESLEFTELPPRLRELHVARNSILDFSHAPRGLRIFGIDEQRVRE